MHLLGLRHVDGSLWARSYLCLCFQAVWSVQCAASSMAPNGSSTGTWRTSMAWSWWRAKETPSGRYFWKLGLDRDFPQHRQQTRQARCRSLEQWVFWWETWTSFWTLSPVWGGILDEVQAMHVTSYAVLCCDWFVNECLHWTHWYLYFCYLNPEFQKLHLKEQCLTAYIVGPRPENREGPPPADFRSLSPSAEGRRSYLSPLFSSRMLEPVSWLDSIKASSCIL